MTEISKSLPILWGVAGSALTVGQIASAIYWSLTGAEWCGGAFVLLVLLATLLQFVAAATIGTVAIAASMSDTFAEVGDPEPLKRLGGNAIRKAVVTGGDLSAIVVLAVCGHPLWAFVYSLQVIFEWIARRAAKERVRMYDEAKRKRAAAEADA